MWHIRIETISSCSPLISLQTGLFTIATRAVSPSYEHILGRFLPVQLTIHKPRISCWPAKAQTWKHVLPLSLTPQNKSHPLIFNRYPFIQLNCNSTRKFVIMTTVRTIDSHASTTAACSSSKEVAEWTNVWAIHSMPVETIATGWATTAEVVAAAAVPTMTISRASEDASKLGISHRYATNSVFRTTSTWQDKRVLTWLCLSRCSPSTFYWSRRYVVPLEGTDYVLFFFFLTTNILAEADISPTVQWSQLYRSTEGLPQNHCDPTFAYIQFKDIILHVVRFNTLFKKTVSWKTNGTKLFSTRGRASFRNVWKVDSWAPFAATQLLQTHLKRVRDHLLEQLSGTGHILASSKHTSNTQITVTIE